MFCLLHHICEESIFFVPHTSKKFFFSSNIRTHMEAKNSTSTPSSLIGKKNPILSPQMLHKFSSYWTLFNLSIPLPYYCSSCSAEAKICQMDRLLCRRQSNFVKLRKLKPGTVIITQLASLPDALASLVLLAAALPLGISKLAKCWFKA